MRGLPGGAAGAWRRASRQGLGCGDDGSTPVHSPPRNVPPAEPLAPPWITVPWNALDSPSTAASASLLPDYSDVLDPEEALEEIAKRQALNATQPAKSLLTLTRKSYVRAGAVDGLAPLNCIIYQMVMELSGRNLPAFDDPEEAWDWLVEHPG